MFILYHNVHNYIIWVELGANCKRNSQICYTNSMLSIIVARTNNGVIGNADDLPWYLPADLKRFKLLTTGHSVIMGRKTFQSIVSRLKKPLPERRNIVITRDKTLTYPGVEIMHSLDEALKQVNNDGFVIGGAEIFKQALPRVGRLYVTEVRADINGDTYFPEINLAQWREVERVKHTEDENNHYDYDFVTFDRYNKNV